jgi:hypothetical protein
MPSFSVMNASCLRAIHHKTCIKQVRECKRESHYSFDTGARKIAKRVIT